MGCLSRFVKSTENISHAAFTKGTMWKQIQLNLDIIKSVKLAICFILNFRFIEIRTFMQLSTVTDFSCTEGAAGFSEFPSNSKKQFWMLKKFILLQVRVCNERYGLMLCRRYLHIGSMKQSQPCFHVHFNPVADIVADSGTMLRWLE